MADAPHAVPTDAAHGAADAAAHGGGHEASFPPFDASLFASQLVWFALTFGVLYFVLSRFVLPKVQTVLDKRAATLKGDLDAAAAESAAAEAARIDMERTAAQARAQARRMIDEERAAATAALAADQAKADAELSAQGATAEKRIAELRAKALTEVGAVADDLARDIVQRLTRGAAA